MADHSQHVVGAVHPSGDGRQRRGKMVKAIDEGPHDPGRHILEQAEVAAAHRAEEMAVHHLLGVRPLGQDEQRLAEMKGLADQLVAGGRHEPATGCEIGHEGPLVDRVKRHLPHGVALAKAVDPHRHAAVGQRLDRRKWRVAPEVAEDEAIVARLGLDDLGLECRCRSRTGIYVWLSWSLLSIPEEGLIYASVLNVDRRKRLERALMQRIELKTVVGSISNNFVNVRFEELDQGIVNALGQLGNLLEADRACLFLFSDDGEDVLNTHEWCGEGVPSLIDVRRVVPFERRKWLIEKLMTLEPMHVPRVADLPREARAERQDFERQGVKSLLRVPMTYAGRLIGAVGLDSVKNHKTWDKDARSLLRLIGEVFAVTLERKRAEEAMRDHLKVIERQETAIQSLSTPIIRVWDGVLALPIVGAVDSRRAAEITHKLLHAIVETKSRHAIVELTGVEQIDNATAHHLLGMLRTIEFLGARGIVAGVRPAVAKTMAALDFNLMRMSIQRDLQHALKLCMVEGAKRREARAAKMAEQSEAAGELAPDSQRPED